MRVQGTVSIWPPQIIARFCNDIRVYYRPSVRCQSAQAQSLRLHGILSLGFSKALPQL